MGNLLQRLRIDSIRSAVLLLALFAMLPAALLAFWAYRNDHQHTTDHAFEKASLLASRTERVLEWEIATARELLQVLASRESIRALNPSLCQEAVSDFATLHPGYTTLSLRRTDGTPICTARTSPTPQSDVVNAPWFAQGLQRDGLHVSDAFRGPQTGRWASVLTMPVRDAGGVTAGLLILPLELNGLAARLFRDSDPDSLVVVTDRTERVLLRSQRQSERVGQPVPERISAMFRLGGTQNFENVGVDGVRRFYASTVMPATGWRVTGAVNADVILAPREAERNQQAAIIVAGLLAAYALGWLLMRRTLVPLATLSRTARAVEGGQTTARVPVSGPRELRQLAQAFNAMLDARAQAERSLRLSEERFRTLNALSADWYWEQDEQLRFVAISEGIGRHIDITAGEHIGKRRWELPCVDMGAADWAEHRARLERHEPFSDFEIKRPGHDGEVRHVLISGVPLFDDNGRFTGYRGVGRDATEERRTRAIISARELRFRSLLEQLPAGVVVHRADTSIELFNPEACHLLQMSADQLLGRTAQDPTWRFLQEDGAPMALADFPVMRVLTSKQPLRGLILGIDHGEGTERTWVLVHGFPEIDVEGQMQSAVIVFIDITLQRRAEALRAAHERAQAANAAKSSFLSRMSHELRTPLNAVLGFSELLSMDPSVAGSPSALRQLEYIQRGGSHLLDLVNDLLDIARIEGGALSIHADRVPLRPLVDECLSLQTKAAERAGVGTRVAGDDGALVAWGDASRIRQILTNLLSNAIKYNRPGGRVEVVLGRQPGRVVVEVSDTGEGLDALALAGLFEPFNRLGAERRGIEGTGLGLVISRELAQAMGGSLTVRSTPGSGSTFSLALPQADAQPAATTVETTPTRRAEPPRRRRVLYVEDNPINAEFVSAALEQRPDIELEVATTGIAGVEAAIARPPDLVLLDIALPDIDGVEVLTRLLAVPALARVPCIALSANAMAPDIARAVAAGFKDYLTKPVRVTELLATLDHWLDPGPPPSA